MGPFCITVISEHLDITHYLTDAIWQWHKNRFMFISILNESHFQTYVNKILPDGYPIPDELPCDTWRRSIFKELNGSKPRTFKDPRAGHPPETLISTFGQLLPHPTTYPLDVMELSFPAIVDDPA